MCANPQIKNPCNVLFYSLDQFQNLLNAYKDIRFTYRSTEINLQQEKATLLQILEKIKILEYKVKSECINIEDILSQQLFIPTLYY